MSTRRDRIEAGPGALPSTSPGGVRKVTLRVELLTRQFGGGSVARQPDRDRWLRPTSVRGALRFWWRALFGAQHPSLQELRAAESAMFGSAASVDSTPGVVSVAVDSEPVGATDPFAPKPGDVSSVAYFPALELGDAQAAHLLRSGPKARVTLSAERACSDVQWAQARAALAAFVTFGGSGARTRRTAGALGWCDAEEAKALGIPTTAEACGQWWSALPTGGVDHRCFSLHDRVLLAHKRASSAEQAQREVLELWREIRQWRRHPPSWTGARPWGRSDWPEADALRVVFERWSLQHAPRPGNEGRAPRAHLGLPLIIKFQVGTGDPEKAELVLSREKGKDRYASPVMTAVARVEHGYLGLVLATKSRLTGSVAIKGRGEPLAVGESDLVYKRIRQQLDEQKFTTIGGGTR